MEVIAYINVFWRSREKARVAEALKAWRRVVADETGEMSRARPFK